MDRVSLHLKSLDKVLPEALELGSDVLLVSGGRSSGRETGTDRLVDPHHVGQLVPTPRVFNGPVSPVLPEERAIFLEEPLERRTTRLFGNQVSIGTCEISDGQLTPPFNQIRISFSAAGFSDGKNQKKSLFLSSGSLEMGSWPAYDSPTSKSTSGIAEPLTENSGDRALVSCGSMVPPTSVSTHSRYSLSGTKGRTRRASRSRYRRALQPASQAASPAPRTACPHEASSDLPRHWSRRGGEQWQAFPSASYRLPRSN